MDAHAATAPAPAGAHTHAHPGPLTYFKVGVVLFILTALEVMVYEIAHRGGQESFGGSLKLLLVPLLLILSAGKFVLVAMFYMHLKQDGKVLGSLFVFPLIVASVVIVALMLLFAYHYAFQQHILF